MPFGRCPYTYIFIQLSNLGLGALLKWPAVAVFEPTTFRQSNTLTAELPFSTLCFSEVIFSTGPTINLINKKLIMWKYNDMYFSEQSSPKTKSAPEDNWEFVRIIWVFHSRRSHKVEEHGQDKTFKNRIKHFLYLNIPKFCSSQHSEMRIKCKSLCL